MKKFIIQLVICILLVSGYWAATQSDIPQIKSAADTVTAQLYKEHTPEGIKKGSAAVVQTIAKLPGKVSGYFEKEEYGEPIDEVFSGDVTFVYAVAGGTVISVGENDSIGKYIIVSHGGKSESIYGNLSDIKVKSMQKIKKGDILASFDKRSGTDFYYSITEK